MTMKLFHETQANVERMRGNLFMAAFHEGQATSYANQEAARLNHSTYTYTGSYTGGTPTEIDLSWISRGYKKLPNTLRITLRYLLLSLIILPSFVVYFDTSLVPAIADLLEKFMNDPSMEVSYSLSVAYFVLCIGSAVLWKRWAIPFLAPLLFVPQLILASLFAYEGQYYLANADTFFTTGIQSYWKTTTGWFLIASLPILLFRAAKTEILGKKYESADWIKDGLVFTLTAVVGLVLVETAKTYREIGPALFAPNDSFLVAQAEKNKKVNELNRYYCLQTYHVIGLSRVSIPPGVKLKKNDSASKRHDLLVLEWFADREKFNRLQQHNRFKYFSRTVLFAPSTNNYERLGDFFERTGKDDCPSR